MYSAHIPKQHHFCLRPLWRCCCWLCIKITARFTYLSEKLANALLSMLPFAVANQVLHPTVPATLEVACQSKDHHSVHLYLSKSPHCTLGSMTGRLELSLRASPELTGSKSYCCRYELQRLPAWEASRCLACKRWRPSCLLSASLVTPCLLVPFPGSMPRQTSGAFSNSIHLSFVVGECSHQSVAAIPYKPWSSARCLYASTSCTYATLAFQMFVSLIFAANQSVLGHMHILQSPV